jgi:hypothetical protein
MTRRFHTLVVGGEMAGYLTSRTLLDLRELPERGWGAPASGR